MNAHEKDLATDLARDRGKKPCPSCGGERVTHIDEGGRFDCLITRCPACGFTAHSDDGQSSSTTWKMFASDPAFKGPHPAGSNARRCYSDLRHHFITPNRDQINCDACDAIRVAKGLPDWHTCWTDDDA